MSRFVTDDLPQRSLRFALQVIEVERLFPRENVGWVVGKQLIRSATSIGANLREADHALTRADFTHKCSLARKEAAESTYWLDLSHLAGLASKERIQPLVHEANELTRILAAIVKNTQIRSKQDQQKYEVAVEYI